jgi:hypothetical protein
VAIQLPTHAATDLLINVAIRPDPVLSTHRYDETRVARPETTASARADGSRCTAGRGFSRITPSPFFGDQASVTMERPTTDSQYRGLRCQ